MEGIIILMLAIAIGVVIALRLIKSKLNERIAKHKAQEIAKQWAANAANRAPRTAAVPIKPKPALPPKAQESKPALLQPEDLEPRDKPIRKTAAKKMYADALQIARPHISTADLRMFKEGFAGSIETYLGMLEQESPDIELEDLKNDLEMLEFDLHDEDDEEPLTTEELAENARIKAAIAARKAEIANLQGMAAFYKQKDLRYLLASEINQLVFGLPAPDYDVLISESAQKHKAALHSTPSRQ